MAIATIKKQISKRNPYRQIVAAIVLQAIKDLKSEDVVTFLDALTWLLYGDAVELMQQLDILAADEAEILNVLVSGGEICQENQIWT